MKKAFIFLIVLVVLLGGAAILYNTLSENFEQPPETDPPPSGTTASPSDTPPEPPTVTADFTVYDEDGTPHKLSDYFGKPIVLNFWASWCGPCRMEMPDFDEKYSEYGDKVTFLMVNLTTSNMETFSKAQKFVKEQGFSFPVLYDLKSDAAVTYGVYSLPTTYFIDKNGVVKGKEIGMISAKVLQNGIDNILK